MGYVYLRPMTCELCHEFYKDFQDDPAIGHYYVYEKETVDHYYENNTVPNRKLFAIMVDGRIVCECKLKILIIASVNATWGFIFRTISSKEKGYGSQAEQMVLK